MSDLSIDEMRSHACEVAGFLKAMANENRLLILCCLVEGEQSVGQILCRVDLSASALSQHLAWLKESGLVTTRRQSQNIFYSIADERASRVLALLKTLFCNPGP